MSLGSSTRWHRLTPALSMKGRISIKRCRHITSPRITQYSEPPLRSSSARLGAMRVRCMCSRDNPRFARSLSRFAIQCSRSLTESQPTQSLMRLRAKGFCRLGQGGRRSRTGNGLRITRGRVQRPAYCTEGTICSGVERAWPLSAFVGARPCGFPCDGFLARAAGSAEALAAFDGCVRGGSGVMILTGGIDEADGKNRVLGGLAAGGGEPGGDAGAGLADRAPPADCQSTVCTLT
jgi:hypothetical protein